MSAHCPALTPKPCRGRLRVSQRDTSNREVEDGQIRNLMGQPSHATCEKCKRVWTTEQLRFYGIRIEEVAL